MELIQLQPTPAIPLTGGSSPAARTIKLTFRYPLTPAERSSGSQSRSHFLKKQCPTKKGWTLSSSSKTFITFYIWELSRLWTHCAHCRWLQHPTRKTSQEVWFIWAIQMNTCLCSFSVFSVICVREVYLEFTDHSISPEWARVTHLQRGTT